MAQRVRQVFGILAILMVCHPVFAQGWLVLPSAFYERKAYKLDGAEVSHSHFYLDGQLFYRWDSGFAAGVLLSTVSGAGNNSYLLTQTGLGLSAGYFREGWVASFSYIPVMNRLEKLNNDTTARNEGSGLQASGGYLFPIATGVFLGPALTFRQVVFTQQKVNTRDQQGATFRLEEWRPVLSAVILL